MLAIASLINDRDVVIKEMMATGLNLERAIDALGGVDFTTESITLATASFDELLPRCQDSLKRSIEAFMVPLGNTLLFAYHTSLEIGNHKAIEILQKALESARQEIGVLASEPEIDFPG